MASAPNGMEIQEAKTRRVQGVDSSRAIRIRVRRPLPTAVPLPFFNAGRGVAHMRTGVAVLCVVVGALALIVGAPLQWGIWIPDVLTGRTVVLQKLRTNMGDHYNLHQSWAGDGYLTEFTHTNSHGRAWSLVIDGDAAKAWEGRLRQFEGGSVEIAVPDHSFLYNPISHAATDSTGFSAWLLEIPEDGSPPFCIRDGVPEDALRKANSR